ncbi:MAG: hypothetical protein ACE5KX_03195 [Acidimicrobiia bacterium]
MSITEKLRRDERGLTRLEWLGIVLLVLGILVFIPQVRHAIDVVYAAAVGKDKLSPTGQPAPGVLVQGIIVVASALLIFPGSIYLINFTNLGRKLGFLVVGTAFFGFLSIVGLLYSLYAPRGLKPVSVEGLNSFQIRILPGAMLLGSLILFGMFVTALNRLEEEEEE